MRPVLREVTLETLGGGALSELFDHELAKVLGNIDDVNTEATAPRTITIKVTLIPSPSRDGATCRLEVASKIAGFLPASTVVYFHREKEGEPLVAMHADGRQLDLEFAADRGEKKRDMDAR